MTEKFEDDLRMEAEGLDKFIKLFNSFTDLSCEFLDTYGDYLDESLKTAIEIVQFEAAMVTEGVFILQGKKFPGLVKQMADVLDEIQVFQAGKDTRREMDSG